MENTIILNRVANIMGLDIRNAQHSIAIEDALAGIQDVDAFAAYLRSNKNSVQFETKTEKLDTLSIRYKKMLIDQSKMAQTASSFTDTLIKWLKEFKTIIKNRIEDGAVSPIAALELSNGTCKGMAFSQKEIKALSELNKTSSQIMEMLETDTLKDALMSLYMRKYVEKRKPVGIDKPKSVMGLIGQFTEGVRA